MSPCDLGQLDDAPPLYDERPSKPSKPPLPPRPAQATKSYDAKNTFRVSGLPATTTRDHIPAILRQCFGVASGTVVVKSLSRQLPDVASSLLVATVCFRVRPDFWRSRTELVDLETGGVDSELGSDYIPLGSHAKFRLTLDQHFLELTPLTPHEDQVVDGRRGIDCIVVHGLNGHAIGSFRHSDSDFVWIRDKLPFVLSSQGQRCLDVATFGYDCHFNDPDAMDDYHTWAENLAFALRAYRSENNGNERRKPMIIIAHSLGGFVWKEAMISLHSSGDLEDKKIIVCTHGALFFGVPTQGMDVTDLEDMIRGRPASAWTVQQLNQELGQSLRMKRNDLFEKAYPYRDSIIFQFCEGQKTRTGRGPSRFLVLPSHAIGRHWENEEQFRKTIASGDHRSMVKFKNNERDFHHVDFVLRRHMLRNAYEIVDKRLVLQGGLLQLGPLTTPQRCGEGPGPKFADSIHRHKIRQHLMVNVD